MENNNSAQHLRKRPVGVVVFGIIAIIIGSIIFYSIIPLTKFTYPFYLHSLPYFIVAILFILSGVGILKLKNWARILFFLLMIIWSFFGLQASRYMQVYYLIYRKSHSLGPIIGWVVYFLLPSLAAFYYFTRPKVKEQFK